MKRLFKWCSRCQKVTEHELITAAGIKPYYLCIKGHESGDQERHTKVPNIFGAKGRGF